MKNKTKKKVAIIITDVFSGIINQFPENNFEVFTPSDLIRENIVKKTIYEKEIRKYFSESKYIPIELMTELFNLKLLEVDDEKITLLRNLLISADQVDYIKETLNAEIRCIIYFHLLEEEFKKRYTNLSQKFEYHNNSLLLKLLERNNINNSIYNRFSTLIDHVKFNAKNKDEVKNLIKGLPRWF